MTQRISHTIIVTMLLSMCMVAPAQTTRPNRLAHEKSPYLLQHAHNPVDWHPWGQEALVRAARENKPILLSIGYSTCHWCHVMERESFSNPQIAALINNNFIAIKVDREERPDIDRIYLAFVQATTGRAGWPLTVFLLPDGRPFAGGTYFPPEDAGGLPGMMSILPRIAELWELRRDQIGQQAQQLTRALENALALTAEKGAAPGVDLLALARARIGAGFDRKHGGFGDAPRFPEPAICQLLLRHHARTGDAQALEMALTTLRAMAGGGIHDHLGGGFHRYSTDRRWFLPHFEKMLPDQALLAMAYLDAHRATGKADLAEVARSTLDYVLAELRGPEGQFLCAQDAQSAADAARPNEKSEGAFYLWTAAQIRHALGDDAELFMHRYGVREAGNVDVDPLKQFQGLNVLFVAHSVAQSAAAFGISQAEAAQRLVDSRRRLAQARQARPHPLTDDKALTAWNGLAISAFARAGAALKEPRYTAAAAGAAAFVRERLYEPQTHSLKRRYRDGESAIDGFLDDYAFYVQGLLDLYEATLDIEWLKLAAGIQQRQDELFWDDQGGGYFTTAPGAAVLMRIKDESDGAEPAGNSIAAMNLLRLGHMLDDSAMVARAKRILALYAGPMREAPGSFGSMLAAVDFSLAPPTQIVLAGDPAAPALRAMLAAVHARYLPNRVILGADGAAGQLFLAQRVPLLKEMRPLAGRPTAHLCQGFVCRQPTDDPAVFAAQLDGASTAANVP